MIKPSLSALCFCMLCCTSLVSVDGSADLAALQTRTEELEKGIRGVEAIRSVKRLQYAYGHYAELGLWHDLADLFADNGVGHYPSGALGREGIRRLFLNEVGKGKLGLSTGQIYPHIMLQPVVTLSSDGEKARARWRVLAMLGSYGGTALWAGGVYENEYVLENGVWKIQDLHYYSRFTGRYDQPGWTADKGKIPMHYNPDQAGMPIPKSYRQETPAGNASALAVLSGRVADLARRAQRLNDENEVANLQHIYGYYLDRKMWDDVADLFAVNGTMELGLQGVYVGRTSIRRALNRFGKPGLREGELNDRLQLQTIVHVAPDGLTAKARGIELAMTGLTGKGGEWGEGIFENAYVKKNGVWQIQSMHFYPRVITDYSQGWAKNAKPAPGPDKTFPPDRPPTEIYRIFPDFHITPFHFPNPVTGLATRYPEGSKPAIGKMPLKPDVKPGSSAGSIPELVKRISAAERQLHIAKAYDASENLASAYGYYLDEFMWDETADLFTIDAKRDLATIGVDVGRENIRESLKRRYPGKKSYDYLIVHQLIQPVIHVAKDAKSALMRVRLFQLAGASGGNGSWIAGVYETATTIENGVWKFRTMDLDYVWAADYRSGWANVSDKTKGAVAAPFPRIIDLPFHYANPVSGRKPPVFRTNP